MPMPIMEDIMAMVVMGLAMGMAMVVTMAVLVITADGTAKDLPMPNLPPMPLLLPMPTLMLMHITEDTTDGEVTAEDTEDITVMDMATTDIGMAKDRPMPILTQMPMLTHITEDTMDTEDTAEDTEDTPDTDMEDIVDTTGDKKILSEN